MLNNWSLYHNIKCFSSSRIEVVLKRKCDHCDRPATHHSVEIIKGKKIEKHLCDQHAADAGLTIKAVHTPINELLTNFVKLHNSSSATSDAVCSECGLTYAQFREHSLLGCAACYEVFEESLGLLLARAHEGAVQHLGKVPRRAGPGQQQQQGLRRMRKRLNEAVESEDFELAARLRDQIVQMEGQAP